MAYLGALPPEMLGTVLLMPHQQRAIERAQRVLDRYGGCLIGEDVGRGKTFVALALAKQWQRPLAVVPAVLRRAWASAMEQAGVACTLVSHESLSRGRVPTARPDGIIVDESHHFRTTSTRRYATMVDLAARVPIILLSATPLQNSTRDLAAQLALFVGESAFALESRALARFVVRSPSASTDAMPRVRAPEWITPAAEDSRVLRAILALAPPPRPVDGGDAGALRMISLVRAWASSRAALTSAVRARRRLATAIEQGIEAGRAPTRREALAWAGGHDAVQLGFASLLMRASPRADDLAVMATALAAERHSLDRLMDELAASPDPDTARAALVRQLRTAHADRRIIAFSEYASTVVALFAMLRRDPGVGLLTAREARLASGHISRDAMLSRFSPAAQRAGAIPTHEHVTLLLATDLISEGTNLQDASVVVHLDLPWNPARLAQRVGRVRRPGGASDIHSYLFAPPGGAAALLDIDFRLRRKLRAAEITIGPSFSVLPSATHATALSAIECDGVENATADGEVASRLGQWRGNTVSALQDVRERRAGAEILTGGIRSRVDGWLAAEATGRLIAAIGGRGPDSGASVLQLAGLLAGPARLPAATELFAAMESLNRWLHADEVAELGGLSDAPPGPLRRTVFRALHRVVQTMPRYQHASLLPVVAELRGRLRGMMPLGLERMLAACACSQAGGMADHQAFVQDLCKIAALPATRPGPVTGARSPVVAMIVFGGEPPE